MITKCCLFGKQNSFSRYISVLMLSIYDSPSTLFSGYIYIVTKTLVLIFISKARYLNISHQNALLAHAI